MVEGIPGILEAAEIFTYAVMLRDFDVGNIDDPRCARFMRDPNYKIEHDDPPDVRASSAQPPRPASPHAAGKLFVRCEVGQASLIGSLKVE